MSDMSGADSSINQSQFDSKSTHSFGSEGETNMSSYSRYSTGLTMMPEVSSNSQKIININKTIYSKPFPIAKSYRAHSIMMGISTRNARVSKMIHESQSRKTRVNFG
jgi:hypothetical protein